MEAREMIRERSRLSPGGGGRRRRRRKRRED